MKTLQTESYNVINKEILAQVFSCEFCEIFKNQFFRDYTRLVLL